RVTFDLTGLPPTPQEIDAFLKDSSPMAFERVVERLLDSPLYGERWAQHWLDVVRYGESNGYELDAERTHAWHYRDYVIRSLNTDLPFDRFVKQQIAGDLAARGRKPRDAADLLIAAGFQRCGPIHLVSGNTDADVNRQEYLTETTTGVALTFLAQTAACARCHNHKFDPISQADYYRLQGFFTGTKPTEIELATDAEKKEIDKEAKVFRAQMAALEKKISALEAPYRANLTKQKKERLEAKYKEALATPADKRTPEQKKLAEDGQLMTHFLWDELVGALAPEDKKVRAAWRAQYYDLEARLPAPAAEAWTVREDETPQATYVLVRGDPKRKGEVVTPAYPRVLVDSAKSQGKAKLDRRDLAEWIAQPGNPLTARVLVNRLWQHHFGKGLVATPNDFGTRGARPSHPELLDWLAEEFVRSGWSIKQLHRLMLLSSTYAQTSRAALDAPGRRLDPENRLLWHMNRQRLEGESLRDHALAATGDLFERMGGPMIRVPIEQEVYDLIFSESEPDGLWPVTPDLREHGRRSIYLFAKRNVRLPMLEAFDRPDALSSCPVRPVSTFAPQALILMNGPFMNEQARTFAGRLQRECGADTDAQVRRAYLLALGRSATNQEIAQAKSFLAHQIGVLESERTDRPQKPPVRGKEAAAAALADFCLALLNCNEFLYVN
ncbi:MAG TPA: DUF1549 and DUF1553 domain-containing protein, partial [Gemmataceae bacterium]|nr:DUF1549 and DUF1553 domain-containing protein [Gemmataceae bacterium]